MRPIAKHLFPCVLVLTAALLPAQALAQRSRGMFLDEAVTARDALVRVRELSDAGNAPEALRVLQKTLEAEGDALIISPGDKDLYLPVRDHILTLLLASPELLQRYRLEQEPAARALLEQGKIAEVESTRLLTTSGLEAVLRLAQVELESARFESARLMLMQLEHHPDRAPGSKAGADAARLAVMIASYLSRPDADAWAQRWTTESLGAAPAVPPQPPVPPLARASGTSALNAQRRPDLAGTPAQPLQSVPLDPERLAQERSGQPMPQYRARFADTPWILPVLEGDRVYVNDGRRISAWDAATLGELWQVSPSTQDSGARGYNDLTIELNRGYARTGATPKEDLSTVAVSQGLVVGAMGVPEANERRGDRRVYAVEAATGRVRWSLDPSWLTDKLAGTIVVGPPVIDADTVVLALRDAGYGRQESRLFLAGVNLYTGGLKWLRLVGSVQNQQFYGRKPSRPDAAVVHQGVVYRGDEMGVLMACEAASGRVRWLRTSPPMRLMDLATSRTEIVPPYEMTVPVIDGESLLFVEFPKGRVVRIGLADGAVQARRDAGSLGEPRYLVLAGGYIAAIGDSRIALVSASELEKGQVRLVTGAGPSALVGRVSRAGDKLLAPVESGASLIDPATPADDEHADFAGAGNLLVAESGGKTHLISADAARLHTYLSWDEAQSLLTARETARPHEAQPLLTHIELASRTGRAAGIAALADRALTLLDADPAAADSARQRSRLFALLLELVRNSRGEWNNPTPAPMVGAAQPVKDPQLLDGVIERLARAADSDAQQAVVLLERAWLRERQNDAPGAIEAYQRVLTDTGLSAIELDAGASLAPSDAAASPLFAGKEATTRLVALARRVGPAPFAAFDDEAAALLRDIPPADAARLEALARAYPVSSASAQAWSAASAAHAGAGDAAKARLAAGNGLAAVELGVTIGRENLGVLHAHLASVLLERCIAANQVAPAYRLAKRLARQSPSMSLTWEGSSAAPAQIASALRQRLEGRSGLPEIGPVLGRGVQVIEGWTPRSAIIHGGVGAGVAGDCVMMVDESARLVSMWGAAAEDGSLRELWSRPFTLEPVAIRVGPDATLMYWPGPGGGVVESVSTSDGTVLWKSAEFASLFDAPSPVAANTPLPTPLDGPVRAGDLLLTADAQTLVMVQRRGLAAAFNIADGAVLWSRALDVTRVYEIEQTPGYVVLGGAGGPKDEGGGTAEVVALEKRTGRETSRLGSAELGDHARWVRAAGNDVVVATARGLLRLAPATGKVVWNVQGEPGARSFAGWVAGDAVFVLDSDTRVWRIALADGSHGENPLDTRDRVVYPVTGTVIDRTLTLSSPMGLVVFNDAGELIGADSLDAEGTIEAPVAAASMFVALENGDREETLQQDAMLRRVFMLAHPTGKLLHTARVRLHDNPHTLTLLDGKVLFSQGPFTMVLDAPAKAPRPSPGPTVAP